MFCYCPIWIPIFTATDRSFLTHQPPPALNPTPHIPFRYSTPFLVLLARIDYAAVTSHAWKILTSRGEPKATISSVQFSSATQSRLTLCDPMSCNYTPVKKRKMESPPQWNPCDLLLSPMWCQFRQLMKMIDVDLHMISKYFAYFHSHWNARTDSSVPQFLPSFI